jgi:hypothetical protein
MKYSSSLSYSYYSTASISHCFPICLGVQLGEEKLHTKRPLFSLAQRQNSNSLLGLLPLSKSTVGADSLGSWTRRNPGTYVSKGWNSWRAEGMASLGWLTGCNTANSSLSWLSCKLQSRAQRTSVRSNSNNNSSNNISSGPLPCFHFILSFVINFS